MFGAIYTAEGALLASQLQHQLERNHIEQHPYQHIHFPWKPTDQVLSFRNSFDRDVNIIIPRTHFSAHDPIQLNWDVTSWIYKQHDNVDPHKLRPDIIFNIQGKDGVMEIGCGEVKKSDVDFDTKEEAKIRVIEIMKRQLNLRLKLAKKLYEGVTFGVVVTGTEITLYEMKMDMENGVYVYQEFPQLILPTTHNTHTHVATSMEVMSSFKV
ncbi:hypothetical protein BDC45DRAFT_513768 [Circinella umbellata]|nr:hypothetical protein BDC45DRAFT_513768 [Circinella umbellata]